MPRADPSNEWWVARGSALEYWFFRTSWIGGALLVDIIDQHSEPGAQVRISVLSNGHASIHRRRVDRGRGDAVRAGLCRIAPNGTVGSVGPVSWDLRLTLEPTTVLVPPALFRWSDALDLTVASRPIGKASGPVQFGDDKRMLTDAPAMACHYWGRRLPDRWFWLSADGFADGSRLEIGIIESRLWGLRVPTPRVGYAWFNDHRDRLVASPLNGLVQLRGWGFSEPVEISLRGLGRKLRIRAGASPDSVVDLGEGIRHSLAACCELIEPGWPDRHTDQAVLEFRQAGHPWPARADRSRRRAPKR